MNAALLAADPSARRRILSVLFIGVFMAALDTAVIAPAIPALRRAFGVSASQIGLVTTVFVLCILSSTALMASLSDRYGRRPVFLINVAFFALGSLVIALAPSFAVVLLGRAIQGVSGGGITPTASAVVGDAFPPEERGKALGMLGATFGMAFLLGPFVASLILLVLSWQWIFLVNLPIAALVIALGVRILPSTRASGVRPPFDWAGIVVLALMLTSMTLGINRMLDQLLGALVWPYLLLLAALCLPLLIAVERRAARPVIPLSLFGTRQLALTYTLAVGAGFGMGSVIFVTSITVAAFHVPDKQVGFLLIPLIICSSAGSVLFGRLLNRLGSRMVMIIGFGALIAGSALLGTLTAQFWLFLAATMLFGLGVGIVVGGTLRAIVLNEVGPDQRGAAQAMLNICISVGNLLTVSVLGAVVDLWHGGVAGFGAAYVVNALVVVPMLLLALGLKSRGQEQHSMQAGLAAAPAEGV